MYENSKLFIMCCICLSPFCCMNVLVCFKLFFKLLFGHGFILFFLLCSIANVFLFLIGNYVMFLFSFVDETNP
jgi:hypothetical protein